MSICVYVVPRPNWVRRASRCRNSWPRALPVSLDCSVSVGTPPSFPSSSSARSRQLSFTRCWKVPASEGTYACPCDCRLAKLRPSRRADDDAAVIYCSIDLLHLPPARSLFLTPKRSPPAPDEQPPPVSPYSTVLPMMGMRAVHTWPLRRVTRSRRRACPCRRSRGLAAQHYVARPESGAQSAPPSRSGRA